MSTCLCKERCLGASADFSPGLGAQERAVEARPLGRDLGL